MMTLPDPHDPTDEQKANLMWMLSTNGVALCRMKHKTTGDWRTVIMVVHHPENGGTPVTYPIGTMMEAGELRTCLDDYELPVQSRRETREEFAARTKAHIAAADPTEELMDRVFPNRNKD